MTPGPPHHAHVDPGVQVIHDALGFATASIAGDREEFLAIGRDALAADPDGFLEALATTVAMLVEEAEDAGADIGTALREIALGVHVAVLAEIDHDLPHHEQPYHEQPYHDRTDPES